MLLHSLIDLAFLRDLWRRRWQPQQQHQQKTILCVCFIIESLLMYLLSMETGWLRRGQRWRISKDPHFGKLFCSYSQLCHSNISFHFCQILALRHSFSIAIILDVLKNVHTYDSLDRLVAKRRTHFIWHTAARRRNTIESHRYWNMVREFVGWLLRWWKLTSGLYFAFELSFSSSINSNDAQGYVNTKE